MSTAKVMIVEDDRSTANLLCTIFNEMGWEVAAVAESAVEAVAKAFTINPDVITMDIMLSGEQSGLDAAEHIRAKLNVPIVFMTSFTALESIDRAQKISSYGYITKPFRAREVQLVTAMALERFKLEQELLQQKQQLELVLANSEINIWDYNFKDETVWVNTDYFEYLGYPPVGNSYKGDDWMRLVNREDSMLARKHMQDYLAGAAELYQMEYRVRDAEGNWRWILDKGRVLQRDLKGEPEHILGTRQDITAVKKSRELQELQYQSLFENSPYGIVMIDPATGKIIKANHNALYLWNHGEGDEELTDYLQLFPFRSVEVSRENLAAVYQALIDANETFTLVSAIGSPNGTQTPVEITFQLCRPAAKTAILAFFKDISERMRFEGELENSKQLYLSTLNSLVEMVLVTDSLGRLLLINNSLVSFIQKTGETIPSRGMDVADCHIFCDLGLPEKITMAVEDRRTVQYQTTMEFGGELLAWDLRLQPGFQNKNVNTVLIRMRDISPERQAAEKLLKARLKAEEASRGKSEFLANISHEIRTPLNSIIGLTRFAQKRTEDKDTIEMLEEITNAGKRLLSMFEGIMEYARIETDSYRPLYAPTIPTKIMEKARDEFQSDFEAMNINFNLGSELNSEWYLDEKLIVRILAKLIRQMLPTWKDCRVELRVEINPAPLKGFSFIIVDNAQPLTGFPLILFNEEERTVDAPPVGDYLDFIVAKKLAGLIVGSITLKSMPKGNQLRVEFTQVEKVVRE